MIGARDRPTRYDYYCTMRDMLGHSYVAHNEKLLASVAAAQASDPTQGIIVLNQHEVSYDARPTIPVFGGLD